MRNETLLKIIIGVFAIILIILGTFAYGNYVRSKQTNQNQTNNNQPSVNKPTESPAPAPSNTNSAQQLPATTPAPSGTQPTKPVATNQAQPAHTPATGAASNAVFGATIIAVGVYIVRKTKQPVLAVSKSKR